MKAVLVTGVGGNVGQYVAENLYMSGYSVIGVYRKSKPRQTSYELIQADLSESILELEGIEAVIHVAAGLYGNTECLVKDNVNSVLNLVKMAEKYNIKKFVYISTVSVYGKVNGELEVSSSITDPEMYGITKYIAENIVKEADIPYRLIVGLPRMLGPFVDLNECRNSGFLTMAKKILRGEDVVCYIPDTVYNNYMHVSDLADFLKVVLIDPKVESCSKVLLGARDKLTMMEILMILKSAVGSNSKIAAKSSGTVPDCTLVSIADAVRMGYRPKPSAQILKAFMEEQKSKLF
mgnify:CR=1 FL=1